MNEKADNRSDERVITLHDRMTFWLGADADRDQCVIDACAQPVPLMVLDTTDIDE